jgi:hypothetical protein
MQIPTLRPSTRRGRRPRRPRSDGPEPLQRLPRGLRLRRSRSDACPAARRMALRNAATTRSEPRDSSDAKRPARQRDPDRRQAATCASGGAQSTDLGAARLRILSSAPMQRGDAARGLRAPLPATTALGLGRTRKDSERLPARSERMLSGKALALRDRACRPGRIARVHSVGVVAGACCHANSIACRGTERRDSGRALCRDEAFVR